MQEQDRITVPTLNKVDRRFSGFDLLTDKSIKHVSIYISISGEAQSQAVEHKHGTDNLLVPPDRWQHPQTTIGAH